MKSGVTIRADNAQAILDALKSLTKKDVLVGILRKTVSVMMFRLAMPGSVTSTNTAHRRKTSPHDRTWSPVLNR